MKIAIAGTRSFGAAVLQELWNEQDMLGVEIGAVFAPLAQDDRTAAAARRLRITTYDQINQSRVADIDLLVCAHTHVYVGQESRRALTLGAIGYHPSLLPRHRGRDAIRWTIKMGDPVAGGTVYWFDSGVDTGPIESQRHVLVKPGETHNELWRDKLFPLGVRMLRDAVARVSDGVIVQQPQDEACATWEPSWERAPLHRPELIEIGPMPEGYRLERQAR